VEKNNGDSTLIVAHENPREGIIFSYSRIKLGFQDDSSDPAIRETRVNPVI